MARIVLFGRTSCNLRSDESFMEIRNYQSADRQQVVNLWNDVFPNSTGHNEPHRAIDRKIAVNDGLFFVALENDILAGTILAGYDGHRGWIYSVAVDPTHKRRGIGSALVRHAQEALQKIGCPKVNLQVRTDNAAVVAFYESLGFEAEQRISMGKRITSTD